MRMTLRTNWNRDLEKIFKQVEEFDSRIEFDFISDSEFFKRHESMIRLSELYDPYFIGLYIAGLYYKDLWFSESQSRRFGRLMNIRKSHGNLQGAENLFFGETSIGIFLTLLKSNHYTSLRSIVLKALENDEKRNEKNNIGKAFHIGPLFFDHLIEKHKNDYCFKGLPEAWNILERRVDKLFECIQDNVPNYEIQNQCNLLSIAANGVYIAFINKM